MKSAKKLNRDMVRFIDKLDKCWLDLPIHRQRLYILYFFACYLLLTTGIIAKVSYEVGRSESKMNIEHIENPFLKKNESPARLQDTVSTIFKNKIYERK